MLEPLVPYVVVSSLQPVAYFYHIKSVPEFKLRMNAL
jgi:hypothetical protein